MTRNLLLAMALLFCAMTPLRAQEHILAYDSTVDIHADGSLDVTERITVRAEGAQIRRGIYRDFPTRYKDRWGQRVVVDFHVEGVLRDGRLEPWFTENLANGVRVNTGDDNLLPVPAIYTYTLHYRTNRQIGFFADHDELYWNAIGTGWVFPIASASVRIRLPQPVAPAELSAEAYTGAQGSRGQDYAATIPEPGLAQWQLTRPLNPREGLTTVLAFPKGLVREPTRSQRLRALLADNRGLLVMLTGFFALLAWCGWRWLRHGRDPRPGTIIVRYEPPAGFSPGFLRLMRRRWPDMRCFSADVLDLAVAGALSIERQSRPLRDAWALHHHPGQGARVLPGDEGTLLDSLFDHGKTVLALKKKDAASLQKKVMAHYQRLGKRKQGAFYTGNGRDALIAALSGMGIIVLAVIANGGQEAGVPAIVLTSLPLTVLVVLFAFLIGAPTARGRQLLDEIEGFRRYLSVAEKPDLARLDGPPSPEPPLDATRFQALLPFAVALSVEEAWSRKFTLAVGAATAAAATSSMAWYHGGSFGNATQFSHAIGSAFTSHISSASTPPGSSSGSGGGGFSGGGGGGGGGGGR